MSKRICKNCGSLDIRTSEYYNGEKCYVCNNCYRIGIPDVFPEYTVFHQITASPEELAERLVYLVRDSYNGAANYYWCSTVTDGMWKTKAEAIAATVAKLKEVCDE